MKATDLVESLIANFEKRDGILADQVWWGEQADALTTINGKLGKRVRELEDLTAARQFHTRYKSGEEKFPLSDGEKQYGNYELAMDMMNHHHFVTTEDDQEVWIYHDQVWQPKGKNTLRESTESRFGDECTTHRSNEVIGHVQRCGTYVNRDVFHPEDVNLVSLQNGVLELDTMTLRAHDHEDYFTYKLPVSYNEGLNCPTVDQFFEDVLHPKDVDSMEELFGYCLLRSYPIATVHFWYGTGRNGKTQMKNLLESFLGPENVSSVSIQQLSENPFAAAEVYLKLANVCGDLPEAPIKYTGIIKNMTGGDRMTVQRKHRDPFQILNYAKAVFIGNGLPQVYDRSVAWWERLQVLEFPNEFLAGDKKTDRDILQKLTTDEELSGLLNIALKGLQRLLKRGGFERREGVREGYLRLSAPVLAFMMDCLEPDDDAFIEKDNLFQAYCAYCRKNGLRAVLTGTFTKELIQYANEINAYVEKKRASYKPRPWGWLGVRFKEGVGGQSTLA